MYKRQVCACVYVFEILFKFNIYKACGENRLRQAMKEKLVNGGRKNEKAMATGGGSSLGAERWESGIDNAR